MCIVIPSVAEPLATLPLLHYVFSDRVDRIYKVQGSLELSFFWVIVIIGFRLTRNGIISIRSVNLIVIVIDYTVQHRQFIRNHRVTAIICSGKDVVFLSKTYDALRSMKAPSLSFEHSRDCDHISADSEDACDEGKVIGGMNYCPSMSWVHGMSSF
ncbi:hypothetical protein M9H77_08954 [Catharanthus roseus]|uniref:Uncharacterized protein n=1 Tax=Catharanthus roseus TaxID=4058 RepID=A0ACC0BZ81_CATRO|nr:hypothetical protein M9H77_08954 [Catharanthus roseus]